MKCRSKWSHQSICNLANQDISHILNPWEQYIMKVENLLDVKSVIQTIWWAIQSNLSIVCKTVFVAIGRGLHLCIYIYTYLYIYIYIYIYINVTRIHAQITSSISTVNQLVNIKVKQFTCDKWRLIWSRQIWKLNSFMLLDY